MKHYRSAFCRKALLRRGRGSRASSVLTLRWCLLVGVRVTPLIPPLYPHPTHFSLQNYPHASRPTYRGAAALKRGSKQRRVRRAPSLAISSPLPLQPAAPSPPVGGDVEEPALSPTLTLHRGSFHSLQSGPVARPPPLQLLLHLYTRPDQTGPDQDPPNKQALSPPPPK